MASSLTRKTLLRYGILGVPLAFAGLPVYVHIPIFYAKTLHLNLAALGGLLLVLRLSDSIIDPLIGLASDRFREYSTRIMALAVPVLLIGYLLLFNPPDLTQTQAFLWLGACMGIVYFSFSVLMINYYARGVEMAETYNDNTRIAAFRESSMLIGVLLASVVPSLLMQTYDIRIAYRIFSMLLVPLFIFCAWICLSVPRPEKSSSPLPPPSFFTVLKNTDIRWVLIVAFSNAIPTAITSTLFMFFTADILRAAYYSGLFLAVYFLSAAFCMPVWAWVSSVIGKKKTLLISMGITVGCFIWAWILGVGDIAPFFVVCMLSGTTLGADSMLLPSMLGDVLALQREANATGFGLWNLTNKLTMAMAAGIALPMLSYGGYSPGTLEPKALWQLSFCYALLPCIFKTFAAALLYFSPLDLRRRTP